MNRAGPKARRGLRPLPPSSLPRRPSPVNARTLTLLAFIGTLVWSLDRAGLLGDDAARSDLVNPGGWTLVTRFLRAALRPDLSPDLLTLTGRSALATLGYAVCATALALVAGLVGGVLASEVWWRLKRGRGAWLGVRALLALPRAIHEAVWGLLLLSVLGLDPLVPILAIAIPYGAITAKVYAEILDETPHDALNALSGAGVPPLRALL